MKTVDKRGTPKNDIVNRPRNFHEFCYKSMENKSTSNINLSPDLTNFNSGGIGTTRITSSALNNKCRGTSLGRSRWSQINQHEATLTNM